MISDEEFFARKDKALEEAWQSYWAQLGERLEVTSMERILPFKQTIYATFGFGFNMGVKFTCGIAREEGGPDHDAARSG